MMTTTMRKITVVVLSVVLALNAPGQAATSRITIPGGGIKCTVNGAVERLTVIPDHQGGARLVLNSATVVEKMSYEPYGRTLEDTPDSTKTTRKYTGQEKDDSTGLYNYNARLYDPAAGLFISPDTIIPNPVSPRTWNRYAYCEGDPINLVDPDGHEPITIFLVARAVVALAILAFSVAAAVAPYDQDVGGNPCPITMDKTGELMTDGCIPAGLAFRDARDSFTAIGGGIAGMTYQPPAPVIDPYLNVTGFRNVGNPIGGYRLQPYAIPRQDVTPQMQLRLEMHRQAQVNAARTAKLTEQLLQEVRGRHAEELLAVPIRNGYVPVRDSDGHLAGWVNGKERLLESQQRLTDTANRLLATDMVDVRRANMPLILEASQVTLTDSGIHALHNKFDMQNGDYSRILEAIRYVDRLYYKLHDLTK